MCEAWKHPTKPSEEIGLDVIEKLPEMFFTNTKNPHFCHLNQTLEGQCPQMTLLAGEKAVELMALASEKSHGRILESASKPAK